MSALLGKPYPVDATCYHGGNCHVRISGSEQGVKEARTKIPGDLMPDADSFWHALREHQLPFFERRSTLYRIMVKPTTPPLEIAGSWLLDWGGAQRWLYSDENAESIRHRVAGVGGHVTVFRRGTQADEASRPSQIFQPLSGPLLAMHQRLKAGFDPKNLFNPGRIYTEL